MKLHLLKPQMVEFSSKSYNYIQEKETTQQTSSFQYGPIFGTHLQATVGRIELFGTLLWSWWCLQLMIKWEPCPELCPLFVSMTTKSVSRKMALSIFSGWMGEKSDRMNDDRSNTTGTMSVSIIPLWVFQRCFLLLKNGSTTVKYIQRNFAVQRNW